LVFKDLSYGCGSPIIVALGRYRIARPVVEYRVPESVVDDQQVERRALRGRQNVPDHRN
jgi:hypothetical protein